MQFTKHSSRFHRTSRKEYLEKIDSDLENDDWEIRVRMWYLNHFRLTPFDDRYTELPFEWLEWSYLNYLNTEDESWLRFSILKSKQNEPDENFKNELSNNTNLSDEDKKKILAAVKARG